MWKEATAAQKKPFEIQAAKDKKKYQTALAKYKETPEYAAFHSTKDTKSLVKKVCKKYGIKAKGKKGKFPSDPNAPQRPLSGFFLFGKDNRPRIMKQVGGNVGLIGKKLGEEWKNISADVKAKYESKAKKAKTAYTAKLEKYKKTAKYNNYVEARTEYNKMKKKM